MWGRVERFLSSGGALTRRPGGLLLSSRNDCRAKRSPPLLHIAPSQRGSQLGTAAPRVGLAGPRSAPRSEPLASAKRAPASPALIHATAPRGRSIDSPVASQ